MKIGNSKTSILIVDDYPVTREGIRLWCENLPDLEICGEASTGQEAVELCQKSPPDLALIDFILPDMDGIETLIRIKQCAPGTKGILLSAVADADVIRRALKAGSKGYLVKDTPAAEFIAALRSISRGATYLCPSSSRCLNSDSSVDGSSDLLGSLSPRQKEVLLLIAEGNSTKEIGHLLGISGKTVDMHRDHLMKKLAIHDIAGLVRFAIRKKLSKL